MLLPSNISSTPELSSGYVKIMIFCAYVCKSELWKMCVNWFSGAFLTFIRAYTNIQKFFISTFYKWGPRTCSFYFIFLEFWDKMFQFTFSLITYGNGLFANPSHFELSSLSLPLFLTLVMLYKSTLAQTNKALPFS